MYYLNWTELLDLERKIFIWIADRRQKFDAAHLYRLDKIYITKILKDYDCDTFFPEIIAQHWKLISDKMVPEAIQSEDNTEFKYEVYERDPK